MPVIGISVLDDVWAKTKFETHNPATMLIKKRIQIMIGYSLRRTDAENLALHYQSAQREQRRRLRQLLRLSKVFHSY